MHELHRQAWLASNGKTSHSSSTQEVQPEEGQHRAMLCFAQLHEIAAAAAAAAAAGKPTDSGISLQAVRELGPDFPLFGVCMGHQCIGEAFGGASDDSAIGLRVMIKLN
jgi:hypothetical protein